jgi:hypothetical protein
MPEYEDTIDLYIRRSVTLDRPEHHARMLEGLRMPDGSADTARLVRARDVCGTVNLAAPRLRKRAGVSSRVG